MYRKALLPIDGSAIAQDAIAQVPNVLSGRETETLVVEVVDTGERILRHTTPAGFDLSATRLRAEIADEVVRAEREAAAEHLAAAHARLRQAGVARVETRIAEGEPGPTIVALAQSAGCDVVVMATHGRSGLTRAELGSVANYVVRHLAGIPVLLIRPATASATAGVPALSQRRS